LPDRKDVDLEDRTKAEALIGRGIKLYSNYVDILLDHDNIVFVQQGEQLRADFPRALFELAFFSGRKEWLEAAVEIRPHIAPERETTLHLLTEIDQTSFAMVEISYQKPPDEIAWQRWRMNTLASQEYAHPYFPNYVSSLLVSAAAGEGKIHSNNYLEIGEEANYRDKSSEIQFPFWINRRKGLGNSADHRFEYDIQFSKGKFEK